MANNIEMQLRMRHEINDIIGDRVADNHHKNDCHYVNAFIAETLRYKGVFPLGVPHVALCDYQLGTRTQK
jgi:cytochrome P450